LKKYITLKLEGDKISADKLRGSISSFYGFVEEIASQVFNRKNPINWIVRVKEGSIELVNEAELIEKLDQKLQDKVFSLIGDGIDILNKEAKIPSNYNERALMYLQDLASIPDMHKNGLEHIDIFIDKERYPLSYHVVANVDALLGVKFKAFGSIEGRLQTISERGSRRFIVYDSLTDRGVRCNIEYDEIMHEAAEAFGRRVYVYGSISYDSFGDPKSIKVEELRVFKENQELPTASEVCGILKG
jgi:hypothetical protein